MSKLRKLTDEEIEEIVTYAIVKKKHLPNTVAESIFEKQAKLFREQLRSVKTSGKLIPSIKEEFRTRYVQAQIEAGDCIGIKTAQNLGEKQTQSTLNQFHRAGSAVKGISLNFTRIIGATKKFDSTVELHLLHSNDSIDSVRKAIKSSLVELTFEQVVKSYEIHLKKENEPWYEFYKLIEEDRFDELEKCIVYKMKMDVLHEYSLTMKEIADTINSLYDDVWCVYSPDCFGELHVFCTMKDVELVCDKSYVTAENMDEIYLDEVVHPTLKTIHICGIVGVKNMYFLQNLKTKKWFLELDCPYTKNSARRFAEILAHPLADTSLTKSNNMWDILSILGIRSAFAFLMEVMDEMMDGIYPGNYKLLVDQMFYTGTIRPISRYSMRHAGPMRAATFEETLKNFVAACVSGTKEQTSGVSTSIVCGRSARIGTGICQVQMDY